jgi:gamma-glutamylputrescine oxidase
LKGTLMPSASYWQRTAPDLSLLADPPSSVDVAVIGGGLMGVATTYWLTRAGIAAALLEREAVGWGATGRNGGFVVAGPARSYLETIDHLGPETTRTLMIDTLINQKLLRQVLEEEHIECQYREPGQLHLALTPHEEKLLRAEAASYQDDEFPVEFLEREDVQKLIHTRLAPNVRGGCLKLEQGLIHSARFVRGLAHAAIRRGAHMYQAEVQAIIPEDQHVCLSTSKGKINAATVVVATNIWTGTLLPELADLLLVRREQMLAYAPMPHFFEQGISATVTSGEYFQQISDGTILIGGCNTVAAEEDKGVWEMRPSPVVQTAIESVLPQLFPDLARLQVTQRWAGLLDYTTDWHPIVDRLPASSRVLVVCGLSGHGMPFGMRFGHLLADTVSSGKLSEALLPYRLARPTLQAWE